MATDQNSDPTREMSDISSLPMPRMSTGEDLVPSPLLRTKDHADHAGLSQPPDHLRQLTTSARKHSRASLSSSSSTAQPAMATKAAMVDSWIRPSSTSRKTQKNLSQFTLIAVLTENAAMTHPRESLLSNPTMTLLRTLLSSKLLLQEAQSQLQ